MIPYFFNYCEHITVNGPSGIMEFPIASLRTGHCELNAVSSNEVKLKNQIYYVLILIHNLFSNTYFSL